MFFFSEAKPEYRMPAMPEMASAASDDMSDILGDDDAKNANSSPPALVDQTCPRQARLLWTVCPQAVKTGRFAKGISPPPTRSDQNLKILINLAYLSL